MKRLIVLAMLLLTAPLNAQNSVYSIAGLGFPGRMLSVRARALGGGYSMFDMQSGLNPAATGAFTSLGAGFSVLNSSRNYDAQGTRVDGLQDTRFPNAIVGSRIGRSRFSFSLGYSLFLERTYDVATSGSIVLRGDTLTTEDRVKSDGGIGDIRVSLARSFGSSFWVGVTGHFISGSTRSSVARDFSDPFFEPVEQTEDIEYFGNGVSVGFVSIISPDFQVAGSFRYDTDISVETSSGAASNVDLPLHASLGFSYRPQLAIRWTTTFSWRNWSLADNDLAAIGLGSAFDTWEIGSGIEIGGAGPGTSAVPIRLGVRYGQLPFSVTAEQPTELNLSFGTGILFASNRASLDLAFERAIRDGAGANEKAWLVTLGLTVRP